MTDWKAARKWADFIFPNDDERDVNLKEAHIELLRLAEAALNGWEHGNYFYDSAKALRRAIEESQSRSPRNE